MGENTRERGGEKLDETRLEVTARPLNCCITLTTHRVWRSRRSPRAISGSPTSKKKRWATRHAEEDSRGRLRVTLPHEITQNRALMLWLHHRVVDLLNDNHLLGVVAEDVEQYFELLTADITSDFIADLLEAGKEAVGASEGQDDERDEPDEGPK